MTEIQKITIGFLIKAAENLNIEKEDIQLILYQMGENLKQIQHLSSKGDFFNDECFQYLQYTPSVNFFIIAMEKLNFFKILGEKEKFINIFKDEIEHMVEEKFTNIFKDEIEYIVNNCPRAAAKETFNKYNMTGLEWI